MPVKHRLPALIATPRVPFSSVSNFTSLDLRNLILSFLVLRPAMVLAGYFSVRYSSMGFQSHTLEGFGGLGP